MSFNRLKYDECETKRYNEETSGPGSYMYNTPRDCRLCWNDNWKSNSFWKHGCTSKIFTPMY